MTIQEIIAALSCHKASAQGSASKLVKRDWFDGYILGVDHAIELLKIWEITEDTKVALAHGEEVR
jgi:hypothetical protein